MMSALYEQRGAQLNISILATDEAQDFINAHASLLDSTFQPVKMSQKMRERLQRSDYVFSGLKTFHELNEAFPSLIDENGDRKPFERFLNDVRRIDETYNAHYLRAEYDFVHSSALMAAKWEQYSEDGDRYLLQYRTAHDDKVRPEHAALDRVTLPMSDRFWEEYFPPNGWNCRCTVERVLRGKYQETPHQEAMQRGDEALNGERYNIFRFNSGIQQKTMPPYNPYTIRRCNDCDIAKGNVELSLPDNELCAACKMLQKCALDRESSRFCVRKKELLKDTSNFTSNSDALRTGEYFQTKKALSNGLKHAYTLEEVNAFEWIPKHLDLLKFVRFSPLGEVKDMSSEKDQRNIAKKIGRGVTGYNIYEISIDSETWQVKTEIRNSRKETLYIAFKKK